jgi:hypothetical protein
MQHVPGVERLDHEERGGRDGDRDDQQHDEPHGRPAHHEPDALGHLTDPAPALTRGRGLGPGHGRGLGRGRAEREDRKRRDHHGADQPPTELTVWPATSSPKRGSRKEG